MLVCNVSMRPQRHDIAADVAEAAAAGDLLISAYVAFALLDDPANATEIVEGFLGEVMVEATSTTDSVDAALALESTMAESAAAADTLTGAIAGISYATFDSWDASGTVVSNADLTATHISTFSATGARSTWFQTTGKYYFEITMGATHGGSDIIGILMSAGVYFEQNNGTRTSSVFSNGAIYSNEADTGIALAAATPGDVTGIAIDLTNRKAWFRRNGGNWNASGTANPATNTGGVTIASGAYAPSVAFGADASATGDNVTGNFGQSAFAFAAPSGFTTWPVPPQVYAAAVTEAATATDLPDATTGIILPLSNVKGWWDASVTASLSLTGSDIDSIADQSGLGNTMSWAGAFSKPTYNATGFNAGTKPAMIFNLGALHTGATGTFPLGTGNTLTLWAVTTMGDTPTMSYGRYFSYAAGGTDFNTPTGFMFARNSTTPTQCSFYRNSAPVASLSVAAHPAPHRLIATVSAAGAITIYIDGVSVGTGTSGGNWGSPGRLLIGCGQTTGDFWYGPIAECGISTDYSDATAVANLDNYLKTKWGL